MFVVSINKKGSVLLNADAAKLEPTLAGLSEDELRMIVIAYDYESPYRQLSELERTRRAQSQVFPQEKDDLWRKKRIREAVSAYMGLQYDERREQVRTYLDKIGNINEAIRLCDATNSVSVVKYIKTNTELRKAITEIDEELLRDEEQDSLKISGKGKLSFLERMLRNKEKYKEVTRKREEFAETKKGKKYIE